MRNGFALYPGLDNTLTENLTLLEHAAACGLQRVFTSLQIPETDTTALKSELGTLLAAARDHHLEVISDVSPATLRLLDIRDFSLSAFRMLGITTLRLDYGFGLQEIVDLSHNRQGMRIQLNASTVTGDILSALVGMKANFHQIDALHNFYPRPGTGVSEELLVHKNLMLHKLGVRVGAFVPTQAGRRRSPLGDGLPTLEQHRSVPVDLAARHLVALGCDTVFLSDALPGENELHALGELRDDCIVLSAKCLTQDPLQQALLSQVYTSREDEARDAIRAQESRPHLKKMGRSITPENTASRPRGAITLDNNGYGRYMGELQILRTDLPADPRTNVVAQIDPEEMFLLKYVAPGRKFSFRLHN